MDGDCWKKPRRIRDSVRLFLWSCCVIRFFWGVRLAAEYTGHHKVEKHNVGIFNSTIFGFYLPQYPHPAHVLHNSTSGLLCRYLLPPQSQRPYEKPAPNITDTAQATSGPFPEINHKEDLEHNAVSRVRRSTFHCDFLGNTHHARICKGKNHPCPLSLPVPCGRVKIAH